MRFLKKGRKPIPKDIAQEQDRDQDPIPRIRWEEIPHTLDLGWYWSEAKEEFQMAKVREQDRATHLYVIGATGTGKTKFLEFLIWQDIRKGNGFGIIDPHGDLIEDVKGLLACHYAHHGDEEIFDRVVLLDPTDPGFTPIFNPLETLPGVPAAEQAQELLAAFKRIWHDSWGVRMEDLLRNSLIALAEAGLTLADLPHFLTSQSFRGAVLEKVRHPISQEYFRRFEGLTERAQLTWIEPVMNKINAFLADERISQIFSLPGSTFNLREIMDEGKILLVKLDKGKLKDSADLLGSLLMAKLQMAAFSRSDLPPKERKPFYLYIDEFQNFASDSFAILLSEARKYGLSLIMAHQTLEQIPSELRSIILGNAGLQVYFRISRKDAQLLAKEAFEYSGYEVKDLWVSEWGSGHSYWSLGEEWEHHIAELQNLPPRFCYVKHKIEGGIIPIQTVEIEPAWEVLGIKEQEYQQFLKGLPFGRKYLLLRDEVLKLIQERTAVLEGEIEKKEKVRLAAEGEKAEIKEGKTRVKLERPSEATEIKVQKPVKPAVKEGKEEREMETEPVPIALSRQSGEPSPAASQKRREDRRHRYLQSLIEKFAKERGFKAVTEESTPDGKKVDVGLELGGKRIACEISITSTPEQELSNIRKCLKAGYDQVILCSPEKRKLAKVESFVSQEIDLSEKEKILFLQPEELLSYLEAEAATLAAGEKRVRGYKVKVSYQPVNEAEREAKREAIAQVLLKALQRMKKES